MHNPANPMMQSYQHQIDASRHIAEAVFDSTDRLEHLMIETTRKAFDEQMKFYQALAATRDPQSIAALQAAYLSHTPEQMTKAQHELMRIVAEAQQQIASTMAHYKTALNGDAPLPRNEALASTASPATNALANVYSMWDKAFKDSFAMANRTMTAVLAPPKTATNGAADKPGKEKAAPKMTRRK